MGKSIIIGYVPSKDSEWLLKRAFELLIGDKIWLPQRTANNSISFKKEAKNAE